MLRSQRSLNEAKHPTAALSASDRVILRFNQSRDLFVENQRAVYIALGVLVVVIAGLFYYTAQRTKNNELASTYLTRVEPYYMNNDFRHAIDGDRTRKVQGEVVHGLKEIVENYGSTTSGSEAALLLANSYYYLGKYDSADVAFDKATTAIPIMAASVDAGHAAVLEAKGQKEEAAKLYEAAAKRDKNNPMNPDYTISAARDLQQIGKTEEAIKIYKQVLEDYQGSQFDDYAKRALLQMNVEL